MVCEIPLNKFAKYETWRPTHPRGGHGYWCPCSHGITVLRGIMRLCVRLKCLVYYAHVGYHVYLTLHII